MRWLMYGGGAVAALALGVGGFAWSVKAQVDGLLAEVHEVPVRDDLPVPWPLSEAEQTAWVEERVNELLAAGQPLEVGTGPEVVKTRMFLNVAALAPTVTADELLQQAEATDRARAALDAEADAMALAKAVERGEHLYQVRLGCAECHGANLEGRVVMDVPPVGRLAGANISKGGKGSRNAASDFTVADYDRIVRHGINRAKRANLMPAADYERLSDRELSDLVAYIEAQPAVDGSPDPSWLGPVLYWSLYSDPSTLAAYSVDHEAARPVEPPPAADTLAFGAHLARTCVGCHRKDYTGGPITGGDPSWPPAPDLTQAGPTADWSRDDFLRAFRDGVRPDGSAIDPAMPWKVLGRMTDEELTAMHAYLQTVGG